MQIEFLSLLFGLGFGSFFIVMGLIWNSYFRIDEGHRGVLTRFGSLVRIRNSDKISEVSSDQTKEISQIKVYSPGGHWKRPWDKVIAFSVMEKVIDLSGEKSGKYAMAADGTVLRLDSKIRFFPKENDYYSYLFELKNPMGHIREMFTCIIRNEIANFKSEIQNNEDVLGSYSVIRTDRKRLNEQVEFICRDIIGQSYGIQFLGVDLIDIIPPQELEVALNGIQNAKSEAETMFARAEADARQKRMAAVESVAIAKTRAESVTLELATLAKMISVLTKEGNLNYYLDHRKTELLGDAKILFMHKGDSKC